MSLAQELVQGVDVWINTPRRPWEACGTSGMKVLVNGGLNLSELDGWWAEAYRADAGWALDGDDGASIGLGCRRGRAAVRSAGAGDHPGVLRAGRAGHSARVGRADPRQHGQPRAELQQQSDAARVRRAALPASRVGVPRPYRRRRPARARAGVMDRDPRTSLERGALHGRQRLSGGRRLELRGASVLWGRFPPTWFAWSSTPMRRTGRNRCGSHWSDDGDVAASTNACVYRGAVPASSRPWWHFTPRIVPHHPDAFVPIEAPFIVWADTHAVRLSGASG